MVHHQHIVVPEEWTKPDVIQVRSGHQSADIRGSYLFHGSVSVIGIEPKANGSLTHIALDIVYNSGERSKPCEFTLRTGSGYHHEIELIRLMRERHDSPLEDSIIGVELKWLTTPTRHVKYLGIPGLISTTIENQLLKTPTFYSHA